MNSQQSDLPFVSVIIPTLNRPAYLEGAIRSLLVQDYPFDKFEVIVVDNASTDNTPQHVELLAKTLCSKLNFKYLREERRGTAFSRNSGAAHAKGDIIIFTDDDALFDRNWISAIVDVYIEYPAVGAVGTKIAIKWDRDPPPWVVNYEPYLGKLDHGNKIIVRRGFEIFGGSLSIRKTVFLRVEGFNPGQKGEYLIGDEDSGLCRKLENENILVAWTPVTTMWHLQLVEKNGTLKDLKRRFINVAISDAYSATFYEWEPKKILRFILKKIYQILGKFPDVVKNGNWSALHLYLTLDIVHYYYFVKYLLLYRFGRNIRHEIMTGEWKFNDSYIAPPLKFNICR